MSCEKVKGKWSTGRLIIGIISMVLFLVISLQSCAVGLGNAMVGNGEVSGTFGFMSAICFLIVGIVGVVTRNSQGKSAPIVICGFYWVVFFLSRIGSGTYRDLRVWGILAFLFGCVYLFAAMKNKKEIIISCIIAVIYFILGII